MSSSLSILSIAIFNTLSFSNEQQPANLLLMSVQTEKWSESSSGQVYLALTRSTLRKDSTKGRNIKTKAMGMSRSPLHASTFERI